MGGVKFAQNLARSLRYVGLHVRAMRNVLASFFKDSQGRGLAGGPSVPKAGHGTESGVGNCTGICRQRLYALKSRLAR